MNYTNSRIYYRLEHVLEDLHDTHRRHFLAGNHKEPDGHHCELFGLALKASAFAALAAGDSLSEWRMRQQRRFGTAAEVAAAEHCAMSQATTLSDTLHALSTRGIWGLEFAHDDLSADPRTDIPSTSPAFSLPVWAGISKIPVCVRFCVPNTRVTCAVVDLLVELPPENRGAHMSRLQSEIEVAEGEEFADPLAYARHLAKGALNSQSALSARVKIDLDLKHQIMAAVSKMPSSICSSLSIQLTAKGNDQYAHVDQRFSVGVMTACPCTLMYSRLRAAKELNLDAPERILPTFTHAQPGILELSVIGPLSAIPSITTLLDVCRSVATLREAVLKRSDEHRLVEESHRRPQFTEDLTRSAITALAARVEADIEVGAAARLDESIHPHQALSQVVGMANQFWRVD